MRFTIERGEGFMNARRQYRIIREHLALSLRYNPGWPRGEDKEEDDGEEENDPA